mgnify:CR=1 FL=1
MKLKEQAEIVIAVSASAIDQHKKRGDIGITYDQEVLRLIDLFQKCGALCGKCCDHTVSGTAVRGRIY